MKKTYLIIFLFFFSLANADKVEVEVIYRNAGNISPNETYRLTKEKEKLKAI